MYENKTYPTQLFSKSNYLTLPLDNKTILISKDNLFSKIGDYVRLEITSGKIVDCYIGSIIEYDVVYALSFTPKAHKQP